MAPIQKSKVSVLSCFIIWIYTLSPISLSLSALCRFVTFKNVELRDDILPLHDRQNDQLPAPRRHSDILSDKNSFLRVRNMILLTDKLFK